MNSPNPVPAAGGVYTRDPVTDELIVVATPTLGPDDPEHEVAKQKRAEAAKAAPAEPAVPAEPTADPEE